MKIYESISNIISEIGAIGKDKKNQQQGFMYRGIDDVMNALQPVLSKHKVFIVPEIIEQSRTERESKSGGVLFYSICKIKYTFFADDGSSISAVVIGEGMDSGDKATNKAMSIAFKYACFQVFCIPTEEMPDPDADTPEPKPQKSSKSANKEKPPKTDSETKATLEQIKELEALAKSEKGLEKATYWDFLKKLEQDGLITSQYPMNKEKHIQWTAKDYETIKDHLEMPF
jgi:hypothetical protein